MTVLEYAEVVSIGRIEAPWHRIYISADERMAVPIQNPDILNLLSTANNVGEFAMEHLFVRADRVVCKAARQDLHFGGDQFMRVEHAASVLAHYVGGALQLIARELELCCVLVV